MNNTNNILNIHVTPKSGRDVLCGIAPDQKGLPLLKIKVRAIPDNGKANNAVIKLLSKSMKVPKSDFKIVRGHKSRYKQISVECSEEKFNNWLENCL